MGLGPPICMDCMMTMKLQETRWFCSKCGDTKNEGFLFCLNKNQVAEVDRNSGTRFLEILNQAHGAT